jgi:hypothetical protein
MYKDEILAKLSERANIAQFVSFAPDGTQRHARISGYENDHRFVSVLEAAQVMIDNSPEKSVNVRSFEPESPKSREFIYGLKNAEYVASHVARLGSSGLYTIINETVDVNDGGVSGAKIGNMIEFAPGDTPRCVEKPGTLQLNEAAARRLFDIVYGIQPTFGTRSSEDRVEFSLHPTPRGVYGEHTIVWELEHVGAHAAQANPQWPNKFSQLIGDKAFGLLMAELIGLPVPRTTVIGRAIAPFTFGTDTGTNEVWIRTCPRVQMPGKFSTFRGWRDPFKIMQDEDPTDENIAAVIAMAGVRSAWSGATITQADGAPLIEGKSGYGDTFMLGQTVGVVPADVEMEVLALYQRAAYHLGDVRMEWCYDGRQVWVVQLHRGRTATQGNVIVPGEPVSWTDFRVEDGLESLRALISIIGERECGIRVIGQVGVTSHVGDVLRKSGIPSHIVIP